MKINQVQGQKYLWKIPVHAREVVQEIAARCSLAYPLAQTLLSRGFVSYEQVQDFLLTYEEKDVADPGLLKDGHKAVKRILRAIEDKEKILIFGDYDVDGITSSSLVLTALLPLGAQVNFYLPNRLRDGYGLSTKIVQKAAQNGYKVIITVDNGITAFEPVRVAKELGIDVIITDHHRPHDHLPDAYAIVNPHQVDCAYPYKYFAGVGVAFKLMSLLYQQKNMKLPDKVIELLLLGTVADVVPLTGENRYWVRHGLAHINQYESQALQVLKQNSNFSKPTLLSTDIGFSITPQINALGRLDDPRQGVAFLIGDDYDTTLHVGKVLHELNNARKEIERSIVEEIEGQIRSGHINLDRENIIMAASKNWPAGVIGLVASRFVGMYGKPTILFHLSSDGLAKGSCRSIKEFNMFNALHEHKELLTSFGGHSVAAGLALPLDNVKILKEKLETLVAQQLSPEDLQLKLEVDGVAQLADFSSTFMAQLEQFEPFGHENKQPYFCVQGLVLVQKPVLLKEAHVKCLVFADGVIKPLIFFYRKDLFDLLVDHGDKPFDVVAQVTQNYWQGNYTIELIGIDIYLGEKYA